MHASFAFVVPSSKSFTSSATNWASNSSVSFDSELVIKTNSSPPIRYIQEPVRILSIVPSELSINWYFGKCFFNNSAVLII